MEPGAAWGGPSELQLAMSNYWCAEEPAPPQVWAAPPGGLPVDYYASMSDMYVGRPTCSSLQAYVPECSLVQQQQQQMVDYNYNYYAAAATQTQQHPDNPMIIQKEAPAADKGFYEDKEELEEHMHKKAQEFSIDIQLKKMHRYPAPPILPDLGKWYNEPCIVAIGPYHHGLDHLEPAEAIKHVAANQCVEESGLQVEDLYGAVIAAVKKTHARHLYRNKDTGLSDKDFLPMMFIDACFLVQCMVWYTDRSGEMMDASLRKFFDHNYNGIRHDMMLLDNQLPWGVVEAVLNLRVEPFDLEGFIALWRDSLQERKVAMEKLPRGFLDTEYKPPHLLGLLRFYIVGKICSKDRTRASDSKPKVESLSFSVSPVELAEMGIILKAKSKTTELAKMGFKEKWYFFFFADLSLPPLALTEARASRLVNMAAHELCTATDFFSGRAADEDSAVCSYLRVLCMLVHREDDVHELRASGILQGAGLTNREALEFLSKFQSLPHGPCYARIMDGIDRYRAKKVNKWLLIPVYRFLYRNWKLVSGVVSAFITVVVFIVKLMPIIKQGH